MLSPLLNADPPEPIAETPSSSAFIGDEEAGEARAISIPVTLWPPARFTTLGGFTGDEVLPPPPPPFVGGGGVTVDVELPPPPQPAIRNITKANTNNESLLFTCTSATIQTKMLRIRPMLY